MLGFGALAPVAAWSQTAPDASAQAPAPGAGSSTTDNASNPAAAQAAPAPSSAAPSPAPAPASPPTTPPQSYGPGDSGSVVSSGVAPVPAPAPNSSAGSGAGASSGQSKAPHYRKFSIGPELGLFIPSDSKTRKRFSGAWFSIGLGLGDIVPPRHGGDLSLDLYLISELRGSRHAYLAPIGVQYRQSLNPHQIIDSNSAIVPYVGASVDLALADVRVPVDNAHSGIRETGGGSVFIGTSLTNRAYVEARYLAVGTTEHFNLSGVQLSAGFRF